MRRFLICLLLLACTGVALAQAPVRPKFGRTFADLAAQQRLVVSNYCRMDFMGARMSPEGWDRIKQFTLMRGNPDFNTVFIISRYQIVDRQSPSYDVTVNYIVIGRYEEGVGYSPLQGIRSAAFETQDTGKEVLIKRVDPASPFVSRQAAIDWLQRKLAVKDIHADERNVIESAIKALTPPPAGAARPAGAAGAGSK